MEALQPIEKKFEQKYQEYLEWKRKRAELFPEFQEPERKKLKEGSWHYEDCSLQGIIVEA